MDKRELGEKAAIAKEIWANPKEHEQKKQELYEDICQRAMRLFPCGLDEYKMLRDGKFREVTVLPSGSVAVTRLLERVSLPDDDGSPSGVEARVRFEHIFKGEKEYTEPGPVPKKPRFSKFKDTGAIEEIQIEFTGFNPGGKRKPIATSKADIPALGMTTLEQMQDLSSSLAIVEEAMASQDSS